MTTIENPPELFPQQSIDFTSAWIICDQPAPDDAHADLFRTIWRLENGRIAYGLLVEPGPEFRDDYGNSMTNPDRIVGAALTIDGSATNTPAMAMFAAMEDDDFPVIATFDAFVEAFGRQFEG